jgi:RNA polymerase sigma-70 factor (ECF subfamily)
MQALTNPQQGVNSLEASTRSATDPERWVERHGDCLFRHAHLRVRDPASAEDLVQETFLAAWRSRNQFAGRSSERTWLLGILKHKIANFYRQRGRQMEPADPDTLAELEASQFKCSLFGDAHWSRSGAPGRWPNPSKSLDQAEFWQILHQCLGKLPENLARAFLLREMEDCEAGTICEDLHITPSNLFVMLHRARLALRRCLELNWFKPGHAGSDRPAP